MFPKKELLDRDIELDSLAVFGNSWRQSDEVIQVIARASWIQWSTYVPLKAHLLDEIHEAQARIILDTQEDARSEP